jgi:hypothetical protein
MQPFVFFRVRFTQLFTLYNKKIFDVYIPFIFILISGKSAKEYENAFEKIFF